MLAYDKASGDQVWKAIINQSSVVSTSPFYDSGTDAVYWVGQDKALHRFDAATGDIGWNTTVSLELDTYNPVVAGGVVGLVDFNQTTNATYFNGYDARSGGLVYTVAIGENYTVPQVYNGNAVFAINPWTSADSTARASGSYLMSVNIATGRVNLN